jgi:hypothetical protein
VFERLIGRPLRYAWLIVIVTFVTQITAAVFRATPGAIPEPTPTQRTGSGYQPTR